MSFVNEVQEAEELQKVPEEKFILFAGSLGQILSTLGNVFPDRSFKERRRDEGPILYWNMAYTWYTAITVVEMWIRV